MSSLQISWVGIFPSSRSSSENQRTKQPKQLLAPKLLLRLEYLSTFSALQNPFPRPPACLPKGSPGAMGQLPPVWLVGAKPSMVSLLQHGRRWQMDVQCARGLGDRRAGQTPRSSGAGGEAGGRSHFAVAQVSLSKHWCTVSPVHAHTSPPGFLGPSS